MLSNAGSVLVRFYLYVLFHQFWERVFVVFIVIVASVWVDSLSLLELVRLRPWPVDVVLVLVVSLFPKGVETLVITLILAVRCLRLVRDHTTSLVLCLFVVFLSEIV